MDKTIYEQDTDQKSVQQETNAWKMFRNLRIWGQR